MLNDLNLSYQNAHQIATVVEESAVEASGINVKKYNKFMKNHIKDAGHEQLTEIPNDLDLKPYEAFHEKSDVALLNKMKSLLKND